MQGAGRRVVRGRLGFVQIPSPWTRPPFSPPRGSTLVMVPLTIWCGPPLSRLLQAADPRLLGNLERCRLSPRLVPPLASVIPLVPTMTMKLLALIRGVKAVPRPLCSNAVVRAVRWFRMTLRVLTMRYLWAMLLVPGANACMILHSA